MELRLKGEAGSSQKQRGKEVTPGRGRSDCRSPPGKIAKARGGSADRPVISSTFRN